MNRILTSLAIALASVAAAPAFADDITPEPPFVSTRSRAEVIAELQQFRRDGVNPWADQYDQLQAFRSTRTRAEVTAEFMGAREEVAAMHSEGGSSSYMLARGRALPAPVLAGLPGNEQ